ncbi:NUMOD4 domain-containing protein [Microbacterium sp. YJN-G]|uniref:NUMOD4 domain-containing protein n=1 Tax=Microbacterium sp. YJN-G TaxID=2763257 RepID=UPI001877DB4B|nr:HNH endonuclease [Microbacterium sp. YJN-G]
MAEEWRPVVGYEGLYEVTASGRVRRITSTHLHAAGWEPSQHRNAHGYVKVGLYRSGEYNLVSVHRIVALAFIDPNPAEGLEVCHRDGDQTNNAATNLYWGTSSQNQNDTIRHGNHRWANRTACDNGHPYTAENTLLSDGKRVCRTCHRERQARYRAASQGEHR